MNITVNYKITLEGNDIDTKKVQKLKKGDNLLLKRINDAEDTYEICICHGDGREIDMLSYAESVGIAPFMDTDEITAGAAVASVQVNPGKSRRKDLTILTVDVEYCAEDLTIYTSPNGSGFIDKENTVATLYTIRVLNGDSDMPVERPYLNLYTLSLPVAQEVKENFEDIINERDTNYSLEIKALFNEEFTKCKVSAFLTECNNEIREIELTEEEKETVLTLVNHKRIFDGEDGINPQIEE